jgi:CheY-like chemotaxis protein/anti-sigma regulatory factor (Ser/Thr protein kinase)
VAAGVAHEINNPAAFVSMNLDAMHVEINKLERFVDGLNRLAAREPDEERQRALKQLMSLHEVDVRALQAMVSDNRDGIERIRSVTRDLRMFSRVEQGEVVEVDLNAVVWSAVNLVANELRHRARVKIELEEIAPLAAEGGRLGQVVTNLLLNAAQAITEGAAESNEITICTAQQDDELVLTVRDTGCGMDEAVRERIFDPFFTTKAREQGTGLGLSLCAEIVAKHGGELNVASTVGEGSCFSVRLPLDNGLTVKARPPRGPVSVRPRTRMLVIDDDAGMVRAYRRMLAQHDAVVVSSGQEALDLIAGGSQFHLILCDLMMPEMDGPQLYEGIAARAPELVRRIVFCTGGAFTARAREFIATIPNPVLDKPITPDMIERLLDPTSSWS